MPKNTKISTEPYKGVRDFYPEDMHLQNYLFEVMRHTAESFGYVEYGASPLEPSDLYKAKTSEEIINEQTYTFKDRGDREVTLRPEMTPTVTRMIAARLRDLPLPIRWYSIPNVFRYERPQQGRLREHYQLNVDLFGVDSFEADVEIVSLAITIMKNFGAKKDDFEIRINDRELMQAFYASFKFSAEVSRQLGKLLDKKNKISDEDFAFAVSEIIPNEKNEFLDVMRDNENVIRRVGEKHPTVMKLVALIDECINLGFDNVFFDPTLVRGFDYYTGFVFEVYDHSPENRRSLFGGGRYNGLMEIFGASPTPAIGFGMGDVTIRDFLALRGLLPAYQSSAELYICRLPGLTNGATVLAKQLRGEGLRVEVDITERKIGDQIKAADKKKVPYIVCVGEEELKSGVYKLKHLATGKEEEVPVYRLTEVIRGANTQ